MATVYFLVPVCPISYLLVQQLDTRDCTYKSIIPHQKEKSLLVHTWYAVSGIVSAAGIDIRPTIGYIFIMG